MRTLKHENYSFCHMLKAAREAKGMTRVKLAELAGVNQNSLTKWEKPVEEGGKTPPIQKMVKLAEVLELDPREIFDLYVEDEPVEVDENGFPWGGTHFRFSDHFRTGDEWLQMKFSVKDVESIDCAVNEASHYASENHHLLSMIAGFLVSEEYKKSYNENQKRRREDFEKWFSGQMKKQEREAFEARLDFHNFLNGNGPDHEDPSRPKDTSNNQEAAPTASAKRTNEGGD